MVLKDKTRKERRKEGRLIKRKQRFSSWLGDQSSKSEKSKEKKEQLVFSKPNPKEKTVGKKVKGKSSSAGNSLSANKCKKVSEKRPKSMFHEYLKMELSNGVDGAEADLEMERRLAKKLKLKDRNLGGLDDGLNMLIEGIPSSLGREFGKFSNSNHASDPDGLNVKTFKRKHEDPFVDDEGDKSKELVSVVHGRKQKSRKSSEACVKLLEKHHPIDKTVEPAEQHDVSNVAGTPDKGLLDANAKYIAPHLRAITTYESEEHAQIRRRVRGLLNKLSETNVEPISGEVAAIFQSVTRGIGCQIVGAEIVASCAGGPRGNEQYAAVFAAFVAGMACLVGVDFSAKLLASVARSFEDEYHKGDSLSLRNLALLFCHLYIFGVSDSDIVFDLLDVLSQRLTELDVSAILTILQCCGMKLRGDNPISMKEFVVAIQNRVNEIKSSSVGIKEGESKINSKRMEFMLETICDIKNNKKRSKEDPAHHVRIKKWLQKLRAEDVLLRNLTWAKLLDPEKKGQWWLSGEINAATVNFEEVATTINKESQEAQSLLQLAAAQRMNTDVRRAIFCIIMSGEDYVDAFEKILRLDLSGKQDREIIRVLVDCCLQEKVFNKYYTVLASKFCRHDKNHKFTLQYCIWDHLKELDSMELHQSMNLARFTSEMLCSFSLSLALLKAVNLMDPAQLTARRIMHFRMLFETLLATADALLWNVFTRVAAAPELESLRSSLIFFIKHYVVSQNSEHSLALKFGIAKKALHNAAGILE